jgi:N-methylhydantoinase A
LLKVGPKSAGADPGPACYPNGGGEPTVTDADLILGYLNPEYFLGGDIRLDKNRSEQVIQEKIASKLKLGVEEAAAGIHNVVNSNMSRAMRIVSVERGYDPSSLTFVAFGGAGPVHAARLARQLKIRKLVVPLAAGVTSALGLLVADLKFDFLRTRVLNVDVASKREIFELYVEMKNEAVKLLADVPYERKFLKLVDMRYSGQAYELSVPFGEGVDEFDFDQLKKDFLRLYQERYGYSRSDPVQCVNWRLIATGVVPKVQLVNSSAGSNQNPKKGSRRAYFPEAGGFIECDIYDRYKLWNGTSLNGPAIIEERESTCVLLPDQRVSVDEYANLLIEN